MKRKYPRATLRKIIKGKRSVNLSKSVDIAVFLGLVLALNKLAKAASNKAQEDRETVITSRHIASVAPDILSSLKG
ncbi:Centromere protein W [Geodia barretti]|uniref:Centromere protein W n=1 Tax=Geodia barretti TaxID=519541 RepID=A0AA35VZJ7_GEOBA|nr:Centromere protein W [Geodia barretti]